MDFVRKHFTQEDTNKIK